VINSGVQPLQNLSVQQQVKSAVLPTGIDVDGRGLAADRVARGLAVCERLVAAAGGRFAAGDVLTVADVCLVPQLYNARRLGVELAAFPALLRVEAACEELPAFRAAHPSAQPDRDA
ncbi:unnamed protein product, partial [Prorocentrum cordatum]